MKTIIIFQGLLLMALTHTQEICQKEEHQAEYSVYNANVEIKVYPCIVTDQNDTQICEKFNYKKLSNYYPLDVRDKCIMFKYADGTIIKSDLFVFDNVRKKRVFVNLCELTASAELLEDTIETERITRQYRDGRYYDTKQRHDIFWPVNACQDLELMYTGHFDVWTYKNRTKYINNKLVGLKLTKTYSFCDHQIWKTGNDGIFVSTHKIKTSHITNLYKELNTSLPHDCRIIPGNNSANDSRIKTSLDHNELHPQPDLHVTEKLDDEVEALYITSEKDIEYLNALVLCLMVVAAFSVLWYLFNVAVNFSSLWTAGRRRTSKSRFYLLNCVSQSFTNRYLFLNGESDTNSKLSAFTSLPHLYESVDYGLPNKPV